MPTWTDPAELLNDEQVREFICNGFLLVNSNDNAALNQRIRDKIARLNSEGGDTAHNILPQITELQQIVDSPVVRGTVQGLLGEDFLVHPHRILVPSEPLPPEQRKVALKGDEDGTPMGDGSRSFSYWHKDTYVPLGKARYHVPRILFMFYFPQDTPFEMGPTRVIPGTHYQDHTTEADYPFACVPENVRAGTCLLTSFDIDHAGMSNRSDRTRYMVKFVFVRTKNPDAPSWASSGGEWQAPDNRLGRHELTPTWSYVWDWMSGRWNSGSVAEENLPQLVEALNDYDQKRRLDAIYTLGAMGETAVEPLMKSLKEKAGKGRINPPYVCNEDGKYENIHDPRERRWTEGGYIFQDEAYALGCIGEPAIAPLTRLLDHEDPWMACNAAFALGEIGATAGVAIPNLARLLESTDHRVVRAALEAIANIGHNVTAALPAIASVLDLPGDHWQPTEPLEYRVGDQIHINAILALLNSDLDIEEMEDLLIEQIEQPAALVYAPAIALEILLRKGTNRGMAHALHYLKAHRWDDT